MTTHLQATLDDLLAQRARLDTAIAALEELRGQIARTNRKVTKRATAARRVSRDGRVRCPDCHALLKPQGMGPHRRSCKKKGGGNGLTATVGPGRKISWDTQRARQMWDAGATAEEIARAVSVGLDAVKKFAFRNGWPKHSKGRRPKTDLNRNPPSLSGRPRQAIKLTQCPYCGAMTTLSPCERCHILIPGATPA